MQRLEDALHRLFHPPPEGIPDHIFVMARNDLSAQVRQRLTAAPADVHRLAEMCEDIERMGTELRELDQNLRQMHQNAAALERGSELHGKRGELILRRDQINARLTEVAAETEQLDKDLGEAKRQETNQREMVEKAERGRTLALLAANYRQAAADIRTQAAIQLRKEIGERVGELWISITERER